VIDSTGSLYAPFGTIALNATRSLTLGDGSLTSVSAGGLTIPYGTTQFGGQQWTYGISSIPQPITAIPSRGVTLAAPNVTLTSKATVNLSGGGDLSAYEWVPGPGGSTDALAPGVQPGLYAILPSTRGQPGPIDPQIGDSSIAAGQSVYLSGGGGLAAGYYPLLPARYGLEPGAFLIRVEPNFQSPSAVSFGTLADGTPVVAGFLSYGSTGLHAAPGYVGFAVYPGSYGTTLAAYDESLASVFFPAAAATVGAPRPNLPADAGSLSIAVTSSLDVAGQVRTAAATGGIAAPVQISAADIVVGAASGTVPADAVTLSGAVLDSWQPGSLLLGGTLTPVPFSPTAAANTPAATINVLANTVTIGAGTTLTAGQIILVANHAIDVQSGANLQTNSAASGVSPASAPPQELVGLSGGAPAFLAVSDLNWVVPVRPGGTPPLGAGTVAIDAGGTIASRGSLTLDGLGGVTVNGTVTGPGAEWSLGSSSIAFVPAGVQSDALAIGPNLVGQLSSAGAIRLASTGSIDVMTPTSLGVGANGTPTLSALTLAATSINNATGPGGSAGATSSEFGGTTLTLSGSGASAPAAMAAPIGSTLTLVAGSLYFGSGTSTLSVNGFAASEATVAGPVIGQGGGGVNVNGDLTIAAAGVTAEPAAAATISATGALTLSAASGHTGSVPQFLGGSLTLSAATVNVTGAITAPSGAVTLTATNDVTVAAGASIDAAGTLVGIGNQTAAAPGGSISIVAGGNLALEPGATLSVAGAGAAAAGTVSLTATGTATMGATLDGAPGSGGGPGGSFLLDAGSLSLAASPTANPLTLLASALGSATPDSGGFTQAIGLRVRTGDLTLATGSELTANAVTLSADGGSLVIDGQISAPSGALRGSLSIFGGTGVTLGATGSLHADGGASGVGGNIEIGTGRLVSGTSGALDTYNAATIVLDAGSAITAFGGAGDGTLLLRAPALTASNGVGITVAPGTSLGQITSSGSLPTVGQIIIEPVLPFNTSDALFSSATVPTSADFAKVGTLVGSFMAAAAPAIATGYGSGGGAPLSIEAGVEIIAPGSLTLPSSGLDLSASGMNWQFNGSPVDLTVRAAGKVEVAGTISDGILTQFVGDDGLGANTLTLAPGASASIRLVAGADLGSANPLTVVADRGGTMPLDLTLDPGVVVRTGTGDIDLVAARNIVLAGAGSGAYTAGVPAIAPGGSQAIPYPGVFLNTGTTAPTPDNDFNGEANNFGVFIPGTNVLMSFPTAGGNLVVRAGQDITNLSTSGPGGVTDWQLREGGSKYVYDLAGDFAVTPVEWGVNLAAYNWNFGTLGGGDVRVSAGRDATNLSIAAADSLLPQASGATPAYVTSGGLTLTAGGNIGSAQVFLADGTGTVTAGGALTATLPSQPRQPNAGSAFYLQTSSIDVSARLGAVVEGAFNSTALLQPQPAGTNNTPSLLQGSFYSYGNSASLSVTTVGGDIQLGTSSSAINTLLGGALEDANGTTNYTGILPPTLILEALSGNLTIEPAFGSRTLYPSPIGQLNLLAAANITGNGAALGRLGMSDAAPGTVADVATPLGPAAVNLALFVGDIHAGDPAPALITAGGSINALSLSIPKATEIVAGQDITDLTFQGQNLNASDTTLISAGRDFGYSSSYNRVAVDVGGPGAVDVLAGRNISLGFSGGIVTTGDFSNANLPTAQGADLTVVAGLGSTPDVAGFVGKIIAPSTLYATQLVNYVEGLENSTGLSNAQASSAFDQLSLAQQLPLVDSVFFSELSKSGLAANTVPGAGFAEGYAAIDALFPGSRTGQPGAVSGAYAGNLTLDFSQIYTLGGGGITLVVPGGLINVGLANPPATLNKKAPSQLGIVTEGTGDIDIFTKSDVNVNSSRIFTLGGGNILIWSDEGSIDAGLGAKTSVSAPPPSILINSDGTISLNFAGAATGSGIRTIQTEPTTPPGNVDLIAPVGTVNAGDAGIGAAGNINIAARSVLGVGNINFGGTATGVPAQVSSVSASLSGAANAASGASNQANNSVASEAAEKEAAAPLAQSALSWLDVFVTGLGEENCKQDDIECLKRQKTPTR
jgi:hypothetical protein